MLFPIKQKVMLDKKELLTGQTMKSIDVGLVFMIILQRVHSIANDCP